LNCDAKVVLEAYDAEDFYYWLYGWMTGVASNSAMVDLPDPVTTSTTEALHWQGPRLKNVLAANCPLILV
jgi:hypothetical protein